jgi:hypothetical protein
MSGPSKIILLVSTILLVLVGAFILYVSWQHNPQCEFHCDGTINWQNWLPYGLISGLCAFFSALVVGHALKIGYSLLSRNSRKL